MIADISDSLGLFIVAGVVGTVIGIGWLFARLQLNASNRPNDERRRQLVDTAIKMRQDGEPYPQRLAYLQTQGLRKDVADEILAEAERTLAA